MFLIVIKKIIFVIFIISFLNGCAQNLVLLAPAYTLATSGNVYHAGFSYGSNEIITQKTGKSTAQNFKEALIKKKEDTEFQKLVKKNTFKTRKKLNFTNP
jgi:hypothetical protein